MPRLALSRDSIKCVKLVYMVQIHIRYQSLVYEIKLAYIVTAKIVADTAAPLLRTFFDWGTEAKMSAPCITVEHCTLSTFFPRINQNAFKPLVAGKTCRWKKLTAAITLLNSAKRTDQSYL